MTETDVLIGQESIDGAEPERGDHRYWSVTTIIGVLDKGGLPYWAANEAAASAVRDVEAWQAIQKSSGDDEAIKWIAKARFRVPPGEREASDLGEAVHKVCEMYALTGRRPDIIDDEIRPYFEHFDAWLQRFSPVYQAAEITVYNRTYGYAGTSDGFFTIDGERLIFDLKTSKKANDRKGKPRGVFPEVALQLAAYRHAELAAAWRPRKFEKFKRRYYLLSQAEIDQSLVVPEVDGGLAIKITPEHCIAYPVRCDERVFKKFLHVLEVAGFTFEMARRVIGDPLQPAEFAA